MIGAAHSGNRVLGRGIVFSMIASLGGIAPLANAAKPSQTCQSPPGRLPVSWQVLETRNFRILSYDTRPASARVGRACEDLRLKLCKKWSGDADLANWTPKCDVVLHPNDASYLKEVGAGAVSTVASSLVDQQGGQTRARRIDVRSVDSDWELAALPHELTHIVFADRFAGQTLPRWIDEGVAILADPTDKQLRHRAELFGAITNRSAFRMVELLALDDYPAADRWGTFYGQSASIVEFLIAQKSPADFVEFVQLSFGKGYDTSLREVYGIGGIAELEQRWRAESRNNKQRVVQAATQTKTSQVGSPKAIKTLGNVALISRGTLRVSNAE